MSSISLSAKTRLPKTGGKVNLDFHDVALKDVVPAIAEITGKNIILDSKAKAKITIISPKPVSIEEAYEAFLISLSNNNLMAVDEGSFTVIRKRKKTDLGDIEVSDDYTSKGELITRVVKLNHIDATKLREGLRKKVSSKGEMVAFGPTNTLFITDTASNVRRIEKMIQLMDKESFKMSTEVVPLKYAQADDVANKLKEIIKSKEGSRRKTSKINNIAGQGDIVNILPDGRTNSLLVTATRKGLEEVIGLLDDLDRKAVLNTTASKVNIRKLRHGNAEEMASLLSGMFSGSGGSKKSSRSSSKSKDSKSSGPVVTSVNSSIFEGEVKVGADPSTNSLIVTASPADYQSISPIIDKLDSRRSQVFVEAMIMEVTMSKDLDVGVSLGGGAGAGGVGGFASTGFDKQPSPLGIGALDAKGLFSQIAGAAGLSLGLAGGTFQLPGTSLNLPISAMSFKALQSNGFVNVLSSPTILTTDNKKAEISVGKVVQVPKGVTLGTNNNPAVQNTSPEQLGIKLAVTPQINDGDSVTLEIEQEIEDVGERDKNGDLPRQKRTISSTVVAQNQQTIALGGLISDKESEAEGKVPVLGNLPLLGHLFKNKQKTSQKVNLLLFLTPHIIRDPYDLTRISVKKNNERRRFNKKHDIDENQALFDYGLDKGLNMAPSVSRVKTKEEIIEKRFEYEKFDYKQGKVINDGEKSSNEHSVMPRHIQEQPDVERSSYIPRAQEDKQDVSRSIPVSSNVDADPFADFQPPSSVN